MWYSRGSFAFQGATRNSNPPNSEPGSSSAGKPDVIRNSVVVSDNERGKPVASAEVLVEARHNRWLLCKLKVDYLSIYLSIYLYMYIYIYMTMMDVIDRQLCGLHKGSPQFTSACPKGI